MAHLPIHGGRVGAEAVKTARIVLRLQHRVNVRGDHAWADAHRAHLAAVAVEERIVPLPRRCPIIVCVHGVTPQAPFREDAAAGAAEAEEPIAHVVAADAGDIVLIADRVIRIARREAQQIK